MKREQLLSAIRKWCRKNDATFYSDAIAGKGSHMRVYVGASQSTIIKSGELPPGYVDLVLKQLGIPKNEIKR
ncbi:MAG TPA: hypothetical protein VFK91_01790 [Methyloceanibacter sp.]|nr:hypothetical protein [Methyloceanibacter sp.]